MTKQEAAAAQARCDATNAYAIVDLSIIRSRSDMDFDNHSREDIRALLADRAALIAALRPLADHWMYCTQMTHEHDAAGEKAYELLHSIGEID